ncbi:MAG: PDZ domain-containing protein [Pseudoflavonifractor sp.]|nr:PDZ domain-containing protein [Alloprevotella sp.]MCM1116394.1 PDZ domain-containing protein [Pseudoflavonifractor sp.]
MSIRHASLAAALCLASAALAAPTAADSQARLLRFPAINGSTIVFSYGGDLYSVPVTGGRASRLTSHEGNEIFPRISPDGASIAFTGQYDGNTEVYSMPITGGEPTRLTFTATNSRDDLGDRMGPNNIVIAWSTDGKEILYRNRTGDGFDGKLWQVEPTGGMPTRLPLPEGGFASWSPDGQRLAYNRVMREFRNWKYYRGGMADDIWIYDPKAQTITNITDNPAQDIIPMWIGNEIYFISDRDMTMNLFAYDTTTGKTRKVTDFTDYDIKFPSTDGKTIVFEKGGYIFRFDPATQQASQIDITLGSDRPIARAERKMVKDHVTAISANPGATRLAITARGEVFDVPVKAGVTRLLTHTPGANDRGAAWSPDGTKVAYISDLSGETEIWLKGADSNAEPRKLTDANDTYIRRLDWTPDSKAIIYTDRRNRMVEVNPTTGAKKTLVTCPESEIRSFAVSPDSRWIAYTRPEKNTFSVVYLLDRTTGKEYPATEKWYNSSSPIFSADGKYLYFNSDRDFNPTYGSLEWNHVYNSLGGLYMTLLSASTPSPFIPTDGEAAPEEAPASATVNIDTDGLIGRILPVTDGAGYYRPIYADDKGHVWYSTRGGVKMFTLADGEETEIARGSMSVDPTGKKAIFRNGSGEIYVTPLPTSKASLTKGVNLSDMVAIVDYQEEWPQIFDETWRAFRDGFYLENMHGVDWKAIREKYAPLLPYCATRYDLNYIIGEMIAELACGHAYVNPGEVKQIERVNMGLLGAELSRDAKTGFYRIDYIIPGAPYSETLRSPLTEPGLGVGEGTYIVAIDGVPTSSTDNIYSLLTGKAGVLTELTVNSKPSADGSKKIVIKPIANEEPLRHYNWVTGNIRKVEEATDGRVGYIYIPDMGPEGLNEFARYFYPQLDKEALIIDDRANGGGNISPMIIERLMRKPYRLTMSRTSSQVGTTPDATHVGPKVLLINKYSASDGDLFPWSFKANNLGTVIGTRTWGGIIGISGPLPYMDGTDVRVPFFTNYDAATGEWIVENHGVDPDILIDNDPLREEAGDDQQLTKAIETALEQLKDRKPLPPVPSPRTFRDLGL